jgi:NAD(P)-dependent dehydrogenase (short-subunit alcohol dehydrogenase family)
MTSPATYPSIAGKRIIITGGAGGIGEFIVRSFVAQGAIVGFIDRSAALGDKLAQELSTPDKTGPHFLCADLTEIDQVERNADALIEQLGGCDVLVNNAANDERHLLSEITPDYWRDRMAVNLDHLIFMSKAVLPSMEKAGNGVILNMGSCSWRLGLGGMTAYVTAKAAIEGLTNGLARELGPQRIRVNCIIPGFIRTQRQIDKWLTPELEKIIFEGQCLPDFVEPADVADMVLFLASDNARMCTSGTYSVDGGWI